MDVFWNPYYHDKIFEEDVPLTLDEWLAIGNTFAMILLAIAVLASIAVLTGLIRYHFSWRIRNWLLISNTMHQKLSGQILKEEYLMQLCGIIGVVVDFVHLDRKEECPDAEDRKSTLFYIPLFGHMQSCLVLDLPPARYVDPFRAPSNIYEQANEKDEDCKTFRNNEPDVFGKTNDGKLIFTSFDSLISNLFYQGTMSRPLELRLESQNHPNLLRLLQIQQVC